jgi:hypothetical protein
MASRFPFQACGVIVVSLVAAGCAKAPASTAVRVGPAAAPPAEPMCRTTGESQVLASNVWANHLTVQARPEGNFEVAVVDVEPCLTIAVARNGAPLGGPALGHCPPSEPVDVTSATNGTETYTARAEQWEAEPPHLVLGVFTWEWPHSFAGQAHEGQRRVVERVFVPPAGGSHDGETMPALAPFGRDRFLLAWVEGKEVRALPLAHWAQPIGEAFFVSPPEARIVAHPSVAFAHDGVGLVAFLATTRTGNHVIATTVYCSP